jgi:hypothetical protein
MSGTAARRTAEPAEGSAAVAPVARASQEGAGRAADSAAAPASASVSAAGPTSASASASASASRVRAGAGIRLPAQLPARFLGTALALAACDAPDVGGMRAGVRVFLLVVVAGFAWWAAPMIDERPVRTSLRWQRIAARRRPTLLAVASVLAAVATDPPTWVAACVVALFLAYLLITDDWIMGSTAPRAARAPGPALTAAGAAALTFVCATVPVASTSWARLPAALALAATAACLALAIRGRRART